MRVKIIGLILALSLSSALYAQSSQAPNPTREAYQDSDSVPIYRISVVARNAVAINYRHRSGSTKVDFRGTPLMPQARGEAKVDSKQGIIKIDTKFEKLQPATTFGPEYLTYVMWAITPEGRAINVGEVLLDDGQSKLNSTVELQSFGLIVTAEPYFAVTQPSDVVIMENFVRSDTEGNVEQIDAKYELLQRGQYTLNVRPGTIKPMTLSHNVPLEFYEAQNAVQIARWTGAERYAAETFQKAEEGLRKAEKYLHNKSGNKSIAAVSREAVQMAEDARIITIKGIQEEQLAKERSDAARREASAKADAIDKGQQAQEEARKREIAETERRAAERATREAELTTRQAEQATLQAEQATRQAEQATRQAESAKQEAQAATEVANREKAQADAARISALEGQKAAEAETDAARLQVSQAEKEKLAIRAQLLQQLNLILETRDTARGLIVNMSDVLFDSGKYTLRAGAREKLAKIAGIVIAHPGLKLEIEGHTDSVGTEESNQQLSEKRAASVRDYLGQQGVPSDTITAKGFGETSPLTSNDTTEGRQQNRRVELVVSGEPINAKLDLSKSSLK